MKKKCLIALGSFLMLFAFVACQPRYIFMPVPGSGTSEAIAPETVAENIDREQLNQDIETVLAGGNVEGLSAEVLTSNPVEGNSSIGYARMARSNARIAIPTTVYIQIIFTGYQNTSSTYISSGEMVLTANGNADSGDAQLNLSTYTATTIRALSIRTSINETTSTNNVAIEIPNAAAITGTVSFTQEGGVSSVSVTISTPADNSGATITVGTTEIPVDSIEGIGEGNNGMFAGGYGTEENPYEISNLTQLLNIGDFCSENTAVYPYFVLTNDIVVDYTDQIEVFGGELNGDNHQITVTGDIVYDSDGDVTAEQLIYRITGSAVIKNLSYSTIGTKSLIDGSPISSGLYPDSVILSNITTAGEIIGTPNCSPLYRYAYAKKVVFEECTNNTNIYGSANTYGAPFLAYLVGGPDENNKPRLITRSLRFDHCVNNGNLVMQGVGFFVGNGGNTGNYVEFYTTDEAEANDRMILLSISDCVNNGSLVGTNSADWYTWNTNDGNSTSWSAINSYAGANTTGNAPKVIKLDGLALSASLSDEIIVLHTDYPAADPDGSKYEYVYEKSYYGFFYRDAELTDFAGTYRTIIEVDADNAGSPVVDRDKLNIMMEDGKELYLKDPGDSAKWTYSVSVYDGNVPVGTASCTYNG